MTIHLHDEQFDGWKHAACGRLDVPVTSDRVVLEDEFKELPRVKRCIKCTNINWPHGGDPE